MNNFCVFQFTLRKMLNLRISADRNGGQSVAIIVNHTKIRMIVRSSLNARGTLVFDAGAINLRKYADTRDIAARSDLRRG